MMRLVDICSAVDGRLEGVDRSVSGVSTNSRVDCSEKLFIALIGPNFDAHDFAQAAVEQGAVALMVERKLDVGVTQIIVSDTSKALTAMAYWWRRHLALPLLAITGSVGKTSVKAMLASILSQQAPTLATEGNLNNEIGVPLTLLKGKPEHRYAVIEMGMNHAGEIERLSQLAAPEVALINNAGPAHLEDLGSIEAVAQAKGEIFSGLSSAGVGVINADDAYADAWRKLIEPRRVMSFALHARADVTATYQQHGEQQKVTMSWQDKKLEFSLPGRGQHNVMNALAAATCAIAVGAQLSSIKAGLERFSGVAGRLQASVFGATQVFDDSYNANPASIKAALDVAKSVGPSWALLGDMAELGAHTEALHQEVGEYAGSLGIERLWACGKHAETYLTGYRSMGGVSGKAFNHQAEMLNQLTVKPDEFAAILIKGSRSAKMETVAQQINELLSTQLADVNSKNKSKIGRDAAC